MATPENYRFNALVPELMVRDLAASLRFWCEGLGFRIAYDRPENGFAYIERGNIQVMLDRYEPDNRWVVGAMEPPFGRGVNFQMFVPDLEPILAGLEKLGWPLFKPVAVEWYRAGNVEQGNRQFLVQDPDGYLLRLAQDMGKRQIAQA